jgi:hypothetical protein
MRLSLRKAARSAPEPPSCTGNPGKRVIRVEALSQSAKALFPPHKCGGSHHLLGQCDPGRTSPAGRLSVTLVQISLLVGNRSRGKAGSLGRYGDAGRLDLSIPCHPCQGGRHPPICHPDRSALGFPATGHSPAATGAAFRKESRMKFANATNLHRKSGVAQGMDLLFALMEKRNLEAICPRHIRCARKGNCRSLPYATLRSG